MTGTTRLGWFEGVGLELEYAIVDADTLSVRPAADWLLAAQGGELATEVPFGPLSWSNELALHQIEMKNDRPAKRAADVGPALRSSVERANELLEQVGARLMPTGMHPWMDPGRELELWPHEGAEIYRAFDRAFRCSRHGFANLQSLQVNLPFGNDDELGRLHAATRLVLPILPALAASSPFVEGRHAGHLDGRLVHYALLTPTAPSFAGRVIPEAVFTEQGYRRDVLDRIQRDLERLGVADVLEAEWCNGRGAIPRFDRSAIEIRLLDMQECPEADVAVAAAVTAAVQGIAETAPAHAQRRLTAESLARILTDVARDAEEAVVDDVAYLRVLGIEGVARATAGEIWRHLVDGHVAGEPDAAFHRAWLAPILEEGCLARRILRRTGSAPDRKRLESVYRELCDCLARGVSFSGHD